MKPKQLQRFLDKAKEVHGDRYDYSNVTFTRLDKDKVQIICPEHGIFVQLASAHLKGQRCRKCYRETIGGRHRKTKDTFVKQANDVHHHAYTYDKFDYTDAHTRSIITCPNHGDFMQSPNVHLKGHGCNVCRKEQSDKWGWSKQGWLRSAKETAKLYIVRVYNETENFVKVGITVKPNVHYRLRQLPYQYEVIEVIEDIPEKIWDLENKIKRTYRNQYKYLPLIPFKGMYECYALTILKTIKQKP